MARPEDGAALAEIYGPYVARTAISFETEVPGAGEMGERIANVLQRTPWLVAEAGHRIAGYAYASVHRDRPAYRWAVDVSVYVADGFHRRGIARRLYGTLLDVLARQGYRCAVAGVALPNDASVALHRACGFETAGVYPRIGYKLGAWHDVMWLTRALGAGDADERGAPREPVAWPEVAPELR
jgi:phosphinothricin acetyltransferase